MPIDAPFLLVGTLTILAVSVGKGAFGGGLAMLGVPLLSLVIDPIDAAILLAPLVAFMDLFALNAFGRSTWSKPDLAWLLPGLGVGVALGTAVVALVDPRWVTLLIAAVTLSFGAHYFLRGRLALPGMRPVAPALALLAGTASGFTTFVAHAGGPPLTMYLLRRGLDKGRLRRHLRRLLHPRQPPEAAALPRARIEQARPVPRRADARARRAARRVARQTPARPPAARTTLLLVLRPPHGRRGEAHDRRPAQFRPVRRLAIAEALAGLALLCAMDALIKGVAQRFPVFEIAFARYLFGSLLILASPPIARPGWPSAETLRANGLRALLVVDHRHDLLLRPRPPAAGGNHRAVLPVADLRRARREPDPRRDDRPADRLRHRRGLRRHVGHRGGQDGPQLRGLVLRRRRGARLRRHLRAVHGAPAGAGADRSGRHHRGDPERGAEPRSSSSRPSSSGSRRPQPTGASSPSSARSAFSVTS